MDLFDNPMNTDGFEFLEFTTTEPENIKVQFANMGFTQVASFEELTLFKQGNINFIVNAEGQGYASDFAKAHGPSVCAMGFRVKDAQLAFERAIELGAKPYSGKNSFAKFDIPAIYGIGDSLIYFIDQYETNTIYQQHFNFTADANTSFNGAGLTYLDHVTHNVKRGEMRKWSKFYEKLFNFREVRYFDIEGKLTGLVSQAMTSPCGKIRIPINESTDDKSQIEEFIKDFNGEGIQHIALGSADIYQSVPTLRANDIAFMSVPETYYETVAERVPWHTENLEELKKKCILFDGAPTPDGGLLLQIFTDTMLGPVFFEVIQRKGNEGFGEGNFKVLFESIERDQISRGVLNEEV